MSDKATALRALIQKVEAGQWDLMRDEPHETTGLLGYWSHFDAIMQYGSLEAAKELHDAVLPGWDLQIEHNVDGFVIWIGPTREEFPPSVGAMNFESAARAWLLAILKALLAQEEAS